MNFIALTGTEGAASGGMGIGFWVIYIVEMCIRDRDRGVESAEGDTGEARDEADGSERN